VTLNVIPRFLRLRDAPSYLGMDRNRFNREVRPCVTEIPIGSQGIAFDRIELDQWADHYMEHSGRLPIRLKGDQIWDAKQVQDFGNAVTSGTSIKRCSVNAFNKALAQATSKKRS